MPAVGNHEYLDKGPMIYRGTFDPPHNGPAEVDSNLVYSFQNIPMPSSPCSTATSESTIPNSHASRPIGSTRL